MNNVKLLKSDVPVYKGLIAGKTVKQLTRELGNTSNYVRARIRRLKRAGYIDPSGKPISDTWELITRKAQRGEDVGLSKPEDNFGEIKLTARQAELLREHQGSMRRSELARLTGLSRTDLCFVIMRQDWRDTTK
ncbi:hypothetical protein ACHHV8_09985 [Paenibacillus sp. TAB 01]|uniref:hypothetical protein n=1 Tax=Paenibacillus sp. TAB 01 TaxID=3368988 RepID=UPI0037500CCB